LTNTDSTDPVQDEDSATVLQPLAAWPPRAKRHSVDCDSESDVQIPPGTVAPGVEWIGLTVAKVCDNTKPPFKPKPPEGAQIGGAVEAGLHSLVHCAECPVKLLEDPGGRPQDGNLLCEETGFNVNNDGGGWVYGDEVCAWRLKQACKGELEVWETVCTLNIMIPNAASVHLECGNGC